MYYKVLEGQRGKKIKPFSTEIRSRFLLERTQWKGSMTVLTGLSSLFFAFFPFCNNDQVEAFWRSIIPRYIKGCCCRRMSLRFSFPTSSQTHDIKIIFSMINWKIQEIWWEKETSFTNWPCQKIIMHYYIQSTVLQFHHLISQETICQWPL